MWSGGNYTKGNNATGGWVGDASLGIGIEAGRHDTQDDDFATGINQCLNKDGSNAATGNLNLGGNKLTNVAVGTVSTDVVTLGQAQAGIDVQSTTLSVNNTRFSNDTVGPYINLQKSRGASVGTNTIVQNGDVVGVVRFNGANGTNFTEGAYLAAFVDGTPGATNDMPTRLVFATSSDGTGIATERMRITNDGKVGIGTSAPVNGINVVDYTSWGGLLISGLFQATKTTTSDAGIAVGSVNGNSPFIAATKLNNGTGTATPLSFKTDNTDRLIISAAGEKSFQNGYISIAASGITSGAGTNALKYDTNTGLVTWDASSILLKENIEDCPYGLDAIAQLQPRKYFRIDDQKEELGFIADEVTLVIPELVSVAEKSRFTNNDEDTEMVPSSIAYEKLTSVLCKAIQELNAKVEALEARIAALEA